MEAEDGALHFENGSMAHKGRKGKKMNPPSSSQNFQKEQTSPFDTVILV
jgi:hypothetical protein